MSLPQNKEDKENLTFSTKPPERDDASSFSPMPPNFSAMSPGGDVAFNEQSSNTEPTTKIQNIYEQRFYALMKLIRVSKMISNAKIISSPKIINE